MTTSLPERPLTGEPLALDLLNTAWPGDGGPVDYLATRAGGRSFAAEHGVTVPDEGLAAAREALLAARAVVGALVDGRGGAGEAARAQAILEHARIVVEVAEAGAGEGGPPAYRVEGSEVAWTVPVRAVLDALDLLARHPGRVRQCAHPACVLWFLDTSRRGARRWCSMATCGNRVKARRHYERARDPG